MENDIRITFDHALSASEADELGFDPLSEELSAGLLQLIEADPPGPGSFVLGLEGRWGSGKSTLLNRIRDKLSQQTSGRKFLLDFDPWWLEEGADLSAVLLSSMLSQLPQSEIKSVGKLISPLLQVTSKFPPGFVTALKLSKKTHPLGEAMDTVIQSGGDIFKLMNQSKTPRQLRDDLAAAFKKNGFRFIIFIDDIDRLTPRQGISVLSSIRSITDLPGVFFVLAYDPMSLLNILRNNIPPLGADYVEKVINLSITVPPAHSSDLMNFLFKRLEPRLNIAMMEETAQPYRAVLMDLIEVPRDAIRVANAANFWHKTKIDEVFIPDLILLEAIRLKSPISYYGITETADIWLRSSVPPREEALWRDQAMGRIERELQLPKTDIGQRIKNALGILFPSAAKLLGPSLGFFPQTVSLNNNTDRRIDNRRYFDTYFMHRPGNDTPREADIRIILGSSTSFDRRSDVIRSVAIDSYPSGNLLVESLHEIRSRIDRGTASKEVCGELISSIGAIGNIISDLSGQARSNLSLYQAAQAIFESSLYKIVVVDERDVESFFKDSTDATVMMLAFLSLTQGTPSYPLEDGPSVQHLQITPSAISRASSIFIELVARGFSEGSIFSSGLAGMVYYCTKKLDAGSLGIYVDSALADSNKVVPFLDSFIGTTDPKRSVMEITGRDKAELRRILVAAATQKHEKVTSSAAWGWFGPAS